MKWFAKPFLWFFTSAIPVFIACPESVIVFFAVSLLMQQLFDDF